MSPYANEAPETAGILASGQVDSDRCDTKIYDVPWSGVAEIRSLVIFNQGALAITCEVYVVSADVVLDNTCQIALIGAADSFERGDSVAVAQLVGSLLGPGAAIYLTPSAPMSLNYLLTGVVTGPTNS